MGRRHRFTQKHALILAALIVVVALSAVAAAGAAPTATLPSTYVQKAVLVGPNLPALPDWFFDQALVDSAAGRLYLADASNSRVDVWDVASGQHIGSVGGFTGPLGAESFNFDQFGPNGLALDDQGQLWAGDGDGSVKVASTKTTFTVIATVKTRAANKVDGIAVDSTDGLVMVTAPAEKHPFVAFIDEKTHALLGTTQVPGAVDLGQPVWSATTHKFYVNVTTKKHGQVDVIDPRTRKVVRVFRLGKCEPSGAVFGPGTQLLVGCATGRPAIIDVVSGKILGWLKAPSTSGRGIDQVAYDSAANRYFLADMSSASVLVVDAGTRKQLSTIADGDDGGHAVAVDSATHKVYVPVTTKGVVVYAPQ